VDRDKRVTLENLLQGLKLQALRVNAVGFPAAPLGQQLTTVRATLPRNSLACVANEESARCTLRNTEKRCCLSAHPSGTSAGTNGVSATPSVPT